MGNEQAKATKTKNNISNNAKPKITIKTPNKKGYIPPPTGFNCNYSNSRSLSPTTHYDDAAQFLETLKSYGSSKFDEVLDEVADEVDPHYNQPTNNPKKVRNMQKKNKDENEQKKIHHGFTNKKNNNKPKPITINKPIAVPFVDVTELIPPQNIVSNIETIFEYGKQLGHGASCRVLKAKHLKNGKFYAVKELKKSFKRQGINESNTESFKKEVELLRKLIHPNILHYYDCYMDDYCYYIATEYCSGMPLKQRNIP